ncbi:MAG TPA: glutathione peroxidase [Ramlibacter sp.]|uniref:glutathione peroxidase n=1 Tax=Ramlibacter sp. TaxID=1917967 RepID=UPI002D0A9EC3|nr:glutathione peroxidase [Ramlibacter sp.]HVZ47082.1 glutathione peroxidase [Ramlibacter sp.]
MLRSIALLLALAFCGAAAHAADTCPASLRFTFPRLQDEAPQALCQYRGKVVLVVNTASYCGYTPQYKGLEGLYAKYRDRGLVVLGFPSNDFEQEKGSNKEIAEFCENTFGVKFPMFGASHVRGAAANAMFRQFAAQGAGEPQWNFYKYMLGRDGRLVGHWPSETTPQELAPLIEKQLAR